MNGRSEFSFGSGMSRALQIPGCAEWRLRGRCRLRFYGEAVGVAVVSSAVVRTPPPSVAWWLA